MQTGHLRTDVRACPVTTPAEQEAERRWPHPQHDSETHLASERAEKRRTFISGWNECESRYRELLEAAEAYRDACNERPPWVAKQVDRLLAAAAALEEATDE